MYSTISSKIETVQGKRVEACILFAGNLRMKSANLQICHAAASATRVNQGVAPWVLQQPLARHYVIYGKCLTHWRVLLRVFFRSDLEHGFSFGRISDNQ